MAEVIPFLPSIPEQELTVSTDQGLFILTARWNNLEEAWYLDVAETNLDPIATGLKAVLGVRMGRTCTHEFFQGCALFMYDLSGDDLEATFDDFGVRVIMVYLNPVDLTLATQVPISTIPRTTDT